VTVSIPATTANLGPGFDCLGLALNLRNQITIGERPAGLSIEVHGEGKGKIPEDHRNLAAQAAERFFAYSGRRPSGLFIHQHNQIPVGSGLGSSAAAVVGGMLAASALQEERISMREVLDLAVEMEGHPDNIAPALFGGLTLVNRLDRGWFVEQIPIQPLQVIVVLPDYDLPTAQARAALPQQVPLQDAVFNAGRVGLLTWALAHGQYDRLAIAMQDRLHQPYRLNLVPGMSQAFEAAIGAGASGVALSGAGPSVVAFAPGGLNKIGSAVSKAFASAGLSSRTWILSADERGGFVTG
jgi:homoserine kinase